jgi:hypothetical protein
MAISSTPDNIKSILETVSAYSSQIKIAPIDTILIDDEDFPVDVMQDLIIEDIGGQELITVSRNDTINGQKISYQPIKNISLIQQTYNPNNILGFQLTSEKYFANFSIKFEEKIPNVGNGPNGSNVYIDSTTGDLVLEFINLKNDEQIEVQLGIDGTIYRAES